MQHQELAEKLGIKKQNINLWIKKKQNISKKYLPILSKMFKVPEEMFQNELNNIDEMNIQRIKLENEIGGIVDSDEKVQKYVEVEGLDVDIYFYESLQKFQDAIDLNGKSINEAESTALAIDLFAELLNIKNNSNLDILKALGILDIINDTLLAVLSFYNNNYSIRKKKHELDKYKSRYYRQRDKAEDVYKQGLYKLLIERDKEEDTYLEKRSK